MGNQPDKRDTDDFRRLVEEETLIADATEAVCELLEEDGVERQELAKRLGKSKGYVTQLLSGERNMTLRTLADLVFALDHRIELRTARLSSPRSYAPFRGGPAVVIEFKEFSPRRRVDIPRDWDVFVSFAGSPSVEQLWAPLADKREKKSASLTEADHDFTLVG